MKWDRIEINWTRLGGRVKSRWRRLTDDDLGRIAGNRERLVGAIHERHGIAVHEAERQVVAWERRADERWLKPPKHAVPLDARGIGQDLPLPHERDQALPAARPEPHGVIEQARRDLENGLVDTDMRATPGLDAQRRRKLVAQG